MRVPRVSELPVFFKLHPLVLALIDCFLRPAILYGVVAEAQVQTPYGVVAVWGEMLSRRLRRWYFLRSLGFKKAPEAFF